MCKKDAADKALYATRVLFSCLLRYLQSFFQRAKLFHSPEGKDEGVHDCMQLLSGRATGSRSKQYLISPLFTALMQRTDHCKTLMRG
eukprot:10179640-Alexandrium_andersonii.AAC.1